MAELSVYLVTVDGAVFRATYTAETAAGWLEKLASACKQQGISQAEQWIECEDGASMVAFHRVWLVTTAAPLAAPTRSPLPATETAPAESSTVTQANGASSNSGRAGSAAPKRRTRTTSSAAARRTSETT